MFDPIYCVKCRLQIDGADTFCKHCGSDQRHPSRRPKTATSADLPAAAVPTQPRQRPSLLLVEHRLIALDDGSQFVTGVVENDADEECLASEIRVNTLDGDGCQIGSLADNAFNIAPHNAWKFLIPVPFPGCLGYTVVLLRGDYMTHRLELEHQRHRQALEWQQEQEERAAWLFFWLNI